MKFSALIILMLFLGCRQSNSDNKGSIEHPLKEFIGCKDPLALNSFFQDLIDDESISNNLYTTYVDSLGYLSMSEIDKYPFDLQLKKFQAPVRIIKKSEINPRNAILTIKNLKKKNDTLFVTIKYDVLNVTWRFKYLEEKACSWKKVADEMEIE